MTEEALIVIINKILGEFVHSKYPGCKIKVWKENKYELGLKISGYDQNYRPRDAFSYVPIPTTGISDISSGAEIGRDIRKIIDLVFSEGALHGGM